MENLKAFFNPKSIAVIGASEREDSLGTRILRNLIGAYQGQIFPVNPFRQQIRGIGAYPSIDRVPSKVDLAIIATPAHTVPQIVEECGKAGVSSVVIVSAGFNECDKNGQSLMRQVLERKREYGLRIIGPNSLGIIRPKSNLYATFGEKKAVAGKIAFISQSAALCGSVLDWSSETQVGLSAVVSTGSMIDVSIGDLIDYFGNDPQTRTIMIYVESLKNVRKFMSATRGYAKTKPIVIVKAGRFTQSTDLVRSQISLLSEDDVYDAAFKRSGIVRVETIGELFDCAKTLSMQPNPNNPYLTIITNASGPGLMAVDQLNARQGKLAQISDASAEKLRSILPYYCTITNPIDILEEANPERFRAVIQACLNDQSNSSLLVIYTPQGLTDPYSIANIVIDLAKQTRKNLLICLMGEDNSCQEARRMLHKNGIPAFRTPEEAVRTFLYMYTYTQNLELLYQTPEEMSTDLGVPIHLKSIIRHAFCDGRQVLNLTESLKFLEAYKIPTVKTLLAKTAEEALSFASKLGYPLTMKGVYSSSVKHEIEGLVFDVSSSSEVPMTFNKLVDNITSNSTADFQAIAIQPQMRNTSCELFLGSKRHAHFGSIIVFGTGGALGQVVRDVSVGFPPLNRVLARQIMKNTKVLKQDKVNDFAGFEAGLVEETLVKFSQLVTDFPEIAEVNIDPIIVKGGSVNAVDARIVIDSSRIMREVADHHEHLAIAPYPRKYITKRTLKNGTKVTLRPIKPEDENRFNELFKTLSQQSVRFRFFEIIKEMSHDTLSRYCNLDYDREIAIVAELEDSKIVGVVRLTLEAEGNKAEFAIMVSDSWQGLGLGSKLVEYIIDIAKDLKLQSIYSIVTPENVKMISLCSKNGFKTIATDEYTVTMSLNLPA